MTRYGMLINTKKCVGCYACRVACQMVNGLAPEESFIAFNEVEQGAYPNVYAEVVPVQCMHCEDAPCEAVCPTHATYTTDSGVVLVDEGKCIGCKYCMAACPYGAPSYDEETSTTFKCDGCYDRRQRGELPACVAACPGANIALDEMDALQSTYEADIVSDEKSGTRPNFVITVDANLAEEPDDLVVEARTA